MKRGFRLVVLVVAAALALVAVPASAGSNKHVESYLALGDSYAFAYNPLIVAAGGASNPTNFVGYANLVAGTGELNLTNAACPGETSGSMITGKRPDNGCQDYRALYPLHTKYKGAQLKYAVRFLHSHHDTDLVTLQIGGNDLLVLLNSCGQNTSCVISGLGPVLATMETNLDIIYAALRDKADYQGTIVAVPYFSFNYNDPSNVFVVSQLDAAIATVAHRHGAQIADVFDAFFAASAPSHVPCLAGLQIPTPGGSSPCDIHPSAAGHAVIAHAIEAVLPGNDD